MLGFIRLDCGQGGDVLLHGNVLSHQPVLIDLQKSRKKMGRYRHAARFCRSRTDSYDFLPSLILNFSAACTKSICLTLRNAIATFNRLENDSAILVLSVQFSSSASSNPNTNQLTKLRKFNIKCNYFRILLRQKFNSRVQLM